MISIDKLKRVNVVYVHADCPDGLASAMILKDAFRMLGRSPEIIFLKHGTEEKHLATPREGKRWDPSHGGIALFCDIAPDYHCDPEDEPLTIVLDHHKGVEELVRSFGENGIFADEKKDPGVSGAVLAFREVWDAVLTHLVSTEGGVVDPPANISSVRDFAQCIGARDTWQTKDPKFIRGQWMSKILMAKPADHWLNPRESMDRDPRLFTDAFLTSDEVDQGRTLYEAHLEAVRQAVDQIVYLTNGVSRCAVFQEQACGARLTSDVAEALREKGTDCKFVAGFSFVVDAPGGVPRLSYSVRGLNGFDVSRFARANGGNGHTGAAGFSVELKLMNLAGPYHDIADRLCAYMEDHADEAR